jgi:hypothetical protein
MPVIASFDDTLPSFLNSIYKMMLLCSEFKIEGPYSRKISQYFHENTLKTSLCAVHKEEGHKERAKGPHRKIRHSYFWY